MSSQRVTAAVAAEDRSAHPAIRGVPWWAAILIAVGASLAGCAIDVAAGNGELTAIFATFYVVGCISAVLAVRHTGIFTAVVQPPLILFVTIPGAYYLLHSAEIAGAKDLVINCFYPLIERFGLMFLTALVVLLIGAARWYLESTKHRSAAGTGTAIAAAGGLLAGLGAWIRGLMSRDGGEPRPDNSGRTRRKPAKKRPVARPPRQQRPTGQAATRSRHARPPMDAPDPPPRRRRAAQPRDVDDHGETPPRRRRAPRDPKYHRDPWASEPWDSERWQPPKRASDDPDRARRTDRRNRLDPYDPYDLYGSPSHLPYSNVRYRGGGDAEDDAGYGRPQR